MRKLGGFDLLSLWDRGSSRHALDRSALLCAWARPELPADSIPDLPLGEITETLLRLRAACFGERIPAHVQCERCGERLELGFRVNELLQASRPSTAREVDVGASHYRLPTLRDLAAITPERDLERAAHQLRARCRLDSAGELTPPPSEIGIAEVENALEAADPNADLAFDVRCEACGHIGTAQLDAGDLLWDEIDVHARSLLNEVHSLASVYGWTEREILSLSPSRRRCYLAMVSS